MSDQKDGKQGAEHEETLCELNDLDLTAVTGGIMMTPAMEQEWGPIVKEGGSGVSHYVVYRNGPTIRGSSK
jgi:hypothetical protein